MGNGEHEQGATSSLRLSDNLRCGPGNRKTVNHPYITQYVRKITVPSGFPVQGSRSGQCIGGGMPKLSKLKFTDKFELVSVG